jgi:hypothetical protein
MITLTCHAFRVVRVIRDFHRLFKADNECERMARRDVPSKGERKGKEAGEEN